MARAYRTISADSHLEISPDRWRDRVPARYRDRAPRVIRLPNGGDAILAENTRLLQLWAHNAGVPWEEWGHDNVKRYEEAVGSGTPEQRLRELDTDGIDAEVLFPGISKLEFLSAIGDDDAYFAVVAAYNEFLAEEYMDADPERFIPAGVIPKRGVDAAIAEMNHCAKLGLKAISLDAYPNGSLSIKPEDDRFWAAALDIDMPVTVHTMFSGMREGRQRAQGLNLARRISTYGTKAAPIATALAIHGVFDRFPKLQIFFAENQIGWIPNYLEQADLIWERHRFYHERAQGLKPLERKPSEIIKEHCLWGFMDNPIGVQLRHCVGVDKVLWSTDFPHDPSDWPNSQATIERNFAGVPEDERYLMLAGNAIRFFKLDAIVP
ncbi:MAG: amidohydrolase family protein [Candidatus Binatia bacterium]